MTAKDDPKQKRDNRLEELAQALQEAQLMLLKQSERLTSIDQDEDEDEDEDDSAREMADMRDKLAVITAERDQLQNQLLDLEQMQTETVALTDDSQIVPIQRAPLPTIDDLIDDPSFGSGEKVEISQIERLGGPSAEPPENDLDEMIAPTVIAPEEFANRPDPRGLNGDKQSIRFLIYTDADKPVRIPLQTGTMTIGRSDSANIRLDGQFVSRIHARVVTRPEDTVIEDAGSKNGFKVNSIAVKHHALQHGDVIDIGKRQFTFVDSVEES